MLQVVHLFIQKNDGQIWGLRVREGGLFTGFQCSNIWPKMGVHTIKTRYRDRGSMSERVVKRKRERVGLRGGTCKRYIPMHGEGAQRCPTTSIRPA